MKNGIRHIEGLIGMILVILIIVSFMNYVGIIGSDAVIMMKNAVVTCLGFAFAARYRVEIINGLGLYDYCRNALKKFLITIVVFNAIAGMLVAVKKPISVSTVLMNCLGVYDGWFGQYALCEYNAFLSPLLLDIFLFYFICFLGRYNKYIVTTLFACAIVIGTVGLEIEADLPFLMDSSCQSHVAFFGGALLIDILACMGNKGRKVIALAAIFLFGYFALLWIGLGLELGSVGMSTLLGFSCPVLILADQVKIIRKSLHFLPIVFLGEHVFLAIQIMAIIAVINS